VVLGEGIMWYQPVGAALVLLGVAVAEGMLFSRTPRFGSKPVR
jgi:hypothetical protein